MRRSPELHVRWREQSANTKAGDKHLRLVFTAYSIDKYVMKVNQKTKPSEKESLYHPPLYPMHPSTSPRLTGGGVVKEAAERRGCRFTPLLRGCVTTR